MASGIQPTGRPFGGKQWFSVHSILVFIVLPFFLYSCKWYWDASDEDEDALVGSAARVQKDEQQRPSPSLSPLRTEDTIGTLTEIVVQEEPSLLRTSSPTARPSSPPPPSPQPSLQSHRPTPSSTTTPKIYVYPFVHNDDTNNNTDDDASTATQFHESFQLETQLLQGLRKRGRITTDPDRATHFWIPHRLVSHWKRTRIESDTTISSEESQRVQDYLDTYLRPWLRQIYYDYPYYNRSQGRDHVFVYSMDGLGPVCHDDDSNASQLLTGDTFVQSMLRSMRKVGYWGQRGLTRPQQSNATENVTRCWQDDLDVAVPPWHAWNTRPPNVTLDVMADRCRRQQKCKKWTAYLRHRAAVATHLFHARGLPVVPGRYCSPGIRPWIQNYCNGTNDHLCWVDPSDNTTTTATTTTTPMTRAVFALSPAGSSCWSSRLFDAFQQLVVPVLMADDMVLPFEQEVDYDSMMEVIKTGDSLQLLAPDGGPAVRRLLDLGQSWMEACRHPTESKLCVQHEVSRKLLAMVRYRRYLGWHDVEKSDKNAFALFEKELMGV